MLQASPHRVAALCAALAVAGPGCHHAVGAPPGQAAADSLTGTVQVVGVEAASMITLVPDGGGRAVTLTGAPTLARVDGLHVAVVGRRAGSALGVERFTVVAANGLPATDGRLLAEGDVLYLVTADGVRHRLVRPSPVLAAHVGSRAWVSGPIDQEPVAYGIIE
jgi:hypothetical protein